MSVEAALAFKRGAGVRADAVADALAAEPSVERHQGHFARRMTATLEAVMRNSRRGVT